MNKPQYRVGTSNAMKSLAKDLGLHYDETMQDWAYEVANQNDIEKYLDHYDTLIDADMKFVMMEMIIQSNNDQVGADKLEFYWNRIEKRLVQDFDIHEYTIYYWAVANNGDEKGWPISPYFRKAFS
jgi:hypothetical protein